MLRDPFSFQVTKLNKKAKNYNLGKHAAIMTRQGKGKMGKGNQAVASCNRSYTDGNKSL